MMTETRDLIREEFTRFRRDGFSYTDVETMRFGAWNDANPDPNAEE